MEVLRVLFVSRGNQNGAISPIVKNQGLSLKQRGVEIEFFTINGKGFSAYIIHLIRLRNKIKKSTYDIIHAHYGLSGIITWLAGRKEKILVSFMGSDLLASDRLNGKLFLSNKFLIKLNIILSGRFYDHSIVKSEEMFKVLKDNGKISVCPNGVNLKEFMPVEREEAIKKAGFPGNDINVIFVADPGRSEKNFNLAKEAILILNNSAIRLHVIKNVNPTELKFYYSAAELLIITSFHEGSPNVVKEAMACNCPIVSTAIGDIPELFGNKPGYFISDYSPEDVAEKVKLAIKYRKTYGQTYGREQIINLGLDEETVADRIVEIYKRISFKHTIDQ